MMKKLLLLCSALFVFSIGVRAQLNVVVLDTIMTDTLHYYLNKHYFKSATTGNLKDFPYFKCAASTFTGVSHCGSKFETCGDTVQVLGLYGYASMNIHTLNNKIPVRLYLCNLGSNGLPVLPAIDSVSSFVGSNAVTTPTLVGGYFPNGRIHTLSSNYAVLIRNVSSISYDTVNLIRTAALTHTNAFATWADKSSDGYGFVSILVLSTVLLIIRLQVLALEQTMSFV